jgi:hypothetical protein
MPRPTIKKGTQKKTNGRSQQAPVIELAEKAVQDYEGERQLLDQMRIDFVEKYPEAAQFLQDIKQQEDMVSDAISSAKILVSQAGQTVGDFLCKKKFSKPRYGDEDFTKLVGQEEDGEIVVELIKGGHVKKIALADSATAWFASHPKAAETYQPAWQDKKELTAAVTTPKLD